MPKTKDTHRKFWLEMRDYEKNIFSVFGDKKAKNPIFSYLKTLPSNFVVADIGCGTGKLLPFRSRKFERVVRLTTRKKCLTWQLA